jgi:hypothetical protein
VSTDALAELLTPTVHFMAVHGASIVRPGERRKLIWVEPQDYSDSISTSFFPKLQNLDVVVIYAAFNGKTSFLSLRGYKDPEKAMREIRRRFSIPKRLKIVE